MKARGGRLRAWNEVSGTKDIDIRAASGAEDLIALDGDLYATRWLGLRASGGALTNLPNFPRGPELVSLERRTAVLRSGETLLCSGDTERTLEPGQAIDAFKWAAKGKIILNRDATLDLAPAEQWAAPQLTAVRDILQTVRDAVRIEGNGDTNIILRANGEVVAWTPAGLAPPDPTIRNVVAIGAAHECWFALQADGTVRMWGRPGNSEGNLAQRKVPANLGQGLCHPDLRRDVRRPDGGRVMESLGAPQRTCRSDPIDWAGGGYFDWR